MNTVTGERADLLGMLDGQRAMLRRALRDLDDSQIRRRTTVSELTLGWVLKHVTEVERNWTDFIVDRYDRGDELPEPVDWTDAALPQGNHVRDGETLAGLLAAYDETARRTDETIAALADLDRRMLLPEAPWNEPGASWSAREVLLWMVRETAHHSGHADIIRESLDGAKTMSF
ncbi:MAG: DUF664 domain-containing protein [Streptosporangiales bacterium]|nr:DUF664 domain-containing protein [Streptosporangiales bacterium]